MKFLRQFTRYQTGYATNWLNVSNADLDAPLDPLLAILGCHAILALRARFAERTVLAPASEALQEA